MSGSDGEASTDSSEDWYEPLAGDLEQGDLLFDFPVLAVSLTDDGQPALTRSRRTVVVLTQTCDIPKKSQVNLLVAEAFPYKQLIQQPGMDHLKRSETKKALREGMAVAELLLPPVPGVLDDDYLLIAFRNLFVLPKSYVLGNLGGGSARLRSPYKEHLAQAYARFMMRVGLPRTLHGFEKIK